jgi:hypothetical protein
MRRLPRADAHGTAADEDDDDDRPIMREEATSGCLLWPGRTKADARDSEQNRSSEVAEKLLILPAGCFFDEITRKRTDQGRGGANDRTRLHLTTRSQSQKQNRRLSPPTILIFINLLSRRIFARQA